MFFKLDIMHWIEKKENFETLFQLKLEIYYSKLLYNNTV